MAADHVAQMVHANNIPLGKQDAGVQARLRGDAAFRGLVLALSLIATIPLILILLFIILRGASSINWQFLT
jgi:hypothetical protein